MTPKSGCNEFVLTVALQRTTRDGEWHFMDLETYEGLGTTA